MAPVERPLIDRLVRWSTLALAAAPVLGMHPMVAVIAVWLVLCAARAVMHPPHPTASAWRWTLVLSAPFLLMLVDLLRADAFGPAWHIAERSTSLLLFPVGFLLLGAPADQRTRQAAIDVFSLAALALSLWANMGMLLDGALHDPTAPARFSDRYRDAFASHGHIHPPFAAYYFVCAALFQTLAALRGERWRMGRGAVAVVLLGSAAAIGSRMPLLAFALGLVPALMIGLPKRIAVRGSLLALGALLVSVAVLPSARQRIRQAFDSGWRTPTAATVNALNIRKPVSECSLELLEAHWLIGMGQPRVQPALDHCYRRYDIPLLLDGSYSTHCQPLHWWISFGLAGLAAFLLLFGAPLAHALRAADGEAIGLLLIIGLCCLTENVLARQWGVVPFAFFTALFVAAWRERAS